MFNICLVNHANCCLALKLTWSVDILFSMADNWTYRSPITKVYLLIDTRKLRLSVFTDVTDISW